jgi:ankyrin repeat protein
MSAASFSQEKYEMPPPFEEEESLDRATLNSPSIMAEEDMVPMSQHSTQSRKRKHRMNEMTVMSISEQEHILYGDQLLDYFMTVGDAPEAAKVQPPAPPANFQVDRPIDDQGNSALHWAAAMGDLDIVRDLLRLGANVQAVSIHEETPLVRAVLFTNNYEKKTMSALVNLLQDNLTFRDWFGATVFHHLAETTRSKGKWKSARYYCEVLLQKLRDSLPPQELEMLLSCQDSNGDTPALVAARNGNFRLTSLFLLHCPDSGNLVNQKGETAVNLMDQANAERTIPLPPSSVTYANEQHDPENAGAIDNRSALKQAPEAATTSALASRIASLMDEANRKLTQAYGSANVGQESADATSPQDLFQQLEKDREIIRKEKMALVSRENASDSLETQTAQYRAIEERCISLVEQIHHRNLSERFTAAEDQPSTNGNVDEDELQRRYALVREMVSAQTSRRAAVRDLIQQKADAGVSTKLDMHRKLVSLATGLKEDELDPMSAELAETLEFDRVNEKTSDETSLAGRALLASGRIAQAMPPSFTVPVDV